MPRYICVAAIDAKRGLADDNGIPWLGKLPSDTKHYHEVIDGGIILMGYATYTELPKPIKGRDLVASTKTELLRPGFELVKDARALLKHSDEDIFVFGGAKLFASVFDLVTDLSLTRLKGDFHCTKFFPEFENSFTLVSKSEPKTESGITFNFESWQKKN